MLAYERKAASSNSVLRSEAVDVPQGGWCVVGTSPWVNGLLICIATVHMCSHRYCLQYKRFTTQFCDPKLLTGAVEVFRALSAVKQYVTWLCMQLNSHLEAGPGASS